MHDNLDTTNVESAVDARQSVATEAGPLPSKMLALQTLVGNAAVARLVQRTAVASAPRPAQVPLRRLLGGDVPCVIMRYQAGAAGHGGIEDEALGAGGAGFSADEVKSIYFGNWLRDFSQLPKHPAALELISILGGGEFGKDVTADDLGDYVTYEHMDNPEGGGSVEDPEVRKDPVKLKAALDKLSPQQRAEYDLIEANRANILAASKTSGLPVYIETGKFHAKEKLRVAISQGQTPDGMRALGDALHSVEDYFSHSNFIEACIFKLKSDPAIKPLVARMAETHLGPSPALLTPTNAAGKVEIQSGHYMPDGNKAVSIIETLETECKSGEMRAAFVAGFIRKSGITGEELGRRLAALAGVTLGGAAGAIVGGASGAVSGAARGLESGWKRGSGFLGTAGAMWDDATSDAQSDAASGAASTGMSWGAAGGIAAAPAGAYLGKSVAELIAKHGIELVMRVVQVPFDALFAAAKAGVLEWIVEHETNESGKAARGKGKLTGPTHAELSKDGSEHKLFAASTALAKQADKEIGTAVRTAWADSNTAGAPTGSAAGPPTAAQHAAIESVVPLVDKFVAHPDASSWWEPIVRAQAASVGP